VFHPNAGHISRSGRVLNYPSHWPGVGLLLLRAAVGITTAMQAWLAVSATNTDLLGAAPAAAWGVCGVALTIGLFTAVCSTLVVVGYALVLFMPFDATVLPRLDSVAAVIGLAAAAALGLLGPGALSVDARLFGRHEIFIPAKDRSDRRG
jgi:hypothetical protein